MPNFLSIPREIRDEIYKWGLLDTIVSGKSRALQRGRKSLAYNKDDPDTYYSEERIRYPEHTSLPPMHALLQTSRQVRAEMLQAIKSMGPVKYKIDLTIRDDKDTMLPTWISIPVISTAVDIVEVHLRVRKQSTRSVCSATGDQGNYEGDFWSGGLLLLQRFLERGVYFLSKKKRQNITIGLLAVNFDIGDEPFDEVSEDGQELTLADYLVDELNLWMRGLKTLGDAPEPEGSIREDSQFRFLVTRIDRLQLAANGTFAKVWDLKEMLKERDEIARERDQIAREMDESAREEETADAPIHDP